MIRFLEQWVVQACSSSFWITGDHRSAKDCVELGFHELCLVIIIDSSFLSSLDISQSDYVRFVRILQVMSLKDHKRIILKCIKNGAELPAYIIIYIYNIVFTCITSSHGNLFGYACWFGQQQRKSSTSGHTSAVVRKMIMLSPFRWMETWNKTLSHLDWQGSLELICLLSKVWLSR